MVFPQSSAERGKSSIMAVLILRLAESLSPVSFSVVAAQGLGLLCLRSTFLVGNRQSMLCDSHKAEAHANNLPSLPRPLQRLLDRLTLLLVLLLRLLLLLLLTLRLGLLSFAFAFTTFSLSAARSSCLLQ